MRTYLLDLARILALLVLAVPFGVMAAGEIGPDPNTLVITATAPDNLPVTGHYTQSIQVNGQFYYGWDWGGPTVLGYAVAIQNPNLTIGYDVFVLDHNSGASIGQNGTVSVGQVIDLKFNPYVYQNIFWFGTGGVVDSPYGGWVAGGAPPSAQVTCDYKDYSSTARTLNGDHNLDQFLALDLDPPTRALSNLTGLSCGALVSGGDGSLTSTCTVQSTGPITPRFDFGSSYGYFYYRYKYNTGPNQSCIGNNHPLAEGPMQLSNQPPRTANGGAVIRPGKVVNVPAFSVNYPLNAVLPNDPPTAPVISGPTTGVTNTSYSFSFVSTDPNGDQLRYGLDWNNDSVVDQWLPASGHVNSGTSQSQGYQWPTAGAQSVRALAQDTNGSLSGWSTHTITISNLPADLIASTVAPTSATSGLVTAMSGTVTNNGDSGAGPFTSYMEVQGGSTYSTNALTLAAGASGTASASVTYATPGTYQVRLCADAGNAVPESNESNNCGAWTPVTVTAPPQPDLTAAAATAPTSATTGVATSIIARVTNVGTASTGGSFLNKAQKATDSSGTGATDIATGSMNTLVAGAFADTALTYTFPVGDAGTTKYIRVCAESASAIVESNESNNCGPWSAVVIAAIPQADLTAGGISPTSATQGVATSISGTITNSGTASTGIPFDSYIEVQGGSTFGTNELTLATGASGTATASVTFATAGTVNVRLCADTTNEIAESNEGNNCGAWTSVTVTAPPQADLTAGVVSPTTATQGVATAFSGTVTNVGAAATSAFGSYIEVQGGSTYGTNSLTLGVGASGSASANVTFASAGTFNVRLCADTTNAVTESNEGNNCGAWTAVTVSVPPQADLTAGSVTPTAAVQGVATSFSGTVTNGGTAASGSFTSYLEVQGGSIYTTNALSLAASGSGTATASITFASTGTFSVRLCADGVGVVSESNEGNNCGTWTPVTVTAPPQADLTAGMVSPTSATQGVATTFSGTVTNGGNAATGSFTSYLEVFGALTYGTNALTLGAGGSGTASANITFASAGSYLVRLCADTANVVSESNEGNNCGSWTTVVVAPPAGQPNLTAGTPSPTTAVAGVATTYTSTISNTGSVSTGSSFTNLIQRATNASGANATDVGTASTATLAASGNTSSSFSVTLTAGTWYLRTCADKSWSGDSGSIGESNEGDNCSGWTEVTVYPTLVAECSVIPTSSVTGQNVTWTASATGGTGSYAYTWGGSAPLAGQTGSSVTVSYSTTGTKTGSVSVTSGSQTVSSVACTANADDNPGTPDGPTVVVTTPQPDLTAGTASAPTSATTGVATNVVAQISNIGTASTGASFTNKVQKAYDPDGTGAADVATASMSTLAAGGSSSTSISYTFPADDGGTTRYLRVCADSTSGITESNEGNNCGAWSAVDVAVPAQADLTAGSVSQSVATQNVSTVFSGTVQNVGTAASGSFTSYIEVQGGSTYTTNALSLAVNGSGTASTNITFASTGTFLVRLCADGFGVVSESNESNNCGVWRTVTVSAPPSQADLTTGVVTAPTSVTVGVAANVVAQVTNAGGSSTGASFTNKVQKADTAGGAGATDVATASMSTLGAGSSSSTSISYTFPAGDAGTTKYLRVCADSTSVITESNEGNNCGTWVAVTVNAVAQPDLSTGAVTSPTSATVGSAATVVALVTNSGNASTGGSFTNKVQKATDASGTGATDVATGAMASIAASGSASTAISYTFPAGDAGTTKYLRVCADSTSSITESNESNNCGGWTAVTVNAVAQPNLSAGAVSPTTATTGVVTTLSATVANTGTASSGTGFTDLFQLASDASGTGATDIGTYSSAAIAQGGFNTASISYTFSSAGTWYVRACADKSSAASSGTITESNESDNCGAWTAITVGTAQPNLSAGSVTPTSATVSIATTFSATVTNSGTASTGATFVNLLQKANDASGGGASDVGTVTAATLAASDSAVVNVNYTFPAGDAGTTKYLRVCADKNAAAGTGTITESNESDNCGAWTAVSVAAVATPTITSCTPSPASAAPNETVTWTVSTTGFSPSPTSYTWNVTGGSPASASGSSNTFGSQFSTGGNYAPTVSATNGSQSAGPFSCTPVSISGSPNTCAEPTVATITASPTRVTSGGSTVVTWSATGVAEGTTCTVTGTDVGGTSVHTTQTTESTTSCNIESTVTTNTVTISNITGQRDYVITCSGGITKTVVVNVLPNFVEF